MNKSFFKKSFLLTIIFFIVVNTLSAQVMIGTGFNSHKINLDESEKIYFKTLNSNYESIKSVNFIGPNLEISYIPVIYIPLGIRLSSDILFPIGYNENNGYRTFQADFKNRNMVSLTYVQSFSSSFGIFADAGYEYDNYRIAKNNPQNSHEEIDYNYFSNQSCFGDLGFYAAINHAYFKFGFNYSHSIINKASSFDMIFAGGFKF